MDSTPGVLASFAEAMQNETRITFESPWVSHGAGKWSVSLSARLSVEASNDVPTETYWHLVIHARQSAIEVDLFPDADRGLTRTFQHQAFNGPPVNTKPWRTGKPCLERPLGNIGRVAWDDEPAEILPKMKWKVEQLLRWIDVAAMGSLVSVGDPFELPDYPTGSLLEVIGFDEPITDLAQWRSTRGDWGYARLSAIPGARDTLALTELFSQAGVSIIKASWSKPIYSASIDVMAVWICLKRLPVARPWQRPMTWRELNEELGEQNVDLADILTRAGINYRTAKRRRQGYKLLLGFPIAERVGDEPRRMHWLALDKIPLAEKLEKRNGFRPTEDNHRRWDRQVAQSTVALVWQRTANWASDQIRIRGEAEDEVRKKEILIIGNGTLGAAVAENLLRMGVTRMGLMDGERLELGNLSRHVLTMTDAGHNKAIALARRLNQSMPDAKVEAIASEFPPNEGIKADLVRRFDVIIDCTASDTVLDAMATFHWGSEKIFVVLSMSWRAEGLLAYAASEALFPTIDAREKFNRAPVPTVNFEEARIEGAGCWHPVFPATADDVQLWAALGSKFVRRTIAAPTRLCTYFRQTLEGEVERIDV